MTLKQLLAAINVFKPAPTAAQIIETKVKDYERHLIVAEEAAAYHAKMGEFYREGLTRLRQQNSPAKSATVSKIA
jgi:hypothetical protein